jgi:hypothetical protein
LFGDSWRSAEDELLRVVSSGVLSTPAGRVLATLGLIQAQLLGRLDVRGALMSLLPVLDELERIDAPAQLAGRAHALAGLVFGAPDSRFFDVGRVNAHCAKADALLDEHADDLRVLLATARISATRFLGPALTMRCYLADLPSLERASSPLSRFMAEGLHGLAAANRGDKSAALQHSTSGLLIAERLGLWPTVVAVLADRAWRALHGSSLPEQVLEITRRACERAKSADIPPSEPLVRVLACEIEALCRLARFDEANAALERALVLAKRAGISRYALAMPVARLYLYTNRVDQLADWAESLQAECSSGSQRALANIHALAVRGMAAGLSGDYDEAHELLARVCAAPESTTGIDYLAHDAHFEYVMVQLLRRDVAGVAAGLRRAFEYVANHPSVWHHALYQRLEGFAMVRAGQHGDARQKLETTVATFALLGDVVQLAFANAGLAVVARSSGAPDAELRLPVVMAELQRLGVWSPQLLRRAQELSAPTTKQPWREESITERLVGAIDRLSVRGLSHDQHRRGLAVLLGELFPGRETVVGCSELDDRDRALVRVGEGAELICFGVRGTLTAEELAALRLLAAFVPRALGGVPTTEPELATDTVLPHVIAAAPATRQLKTEIARLSRSSATVLIGGESGSGKEVVARAVHDLSSRHDRPYIVFNCASVPRDLFESQLFGYRKGAFTGAATDSPGVIRAADGGTLFLDEIGELPLDTQPKLLRFLENGEVFPLGEQKARRVDVRILAATHRDLDKLVREGKFREDLYYRLNVVPLHVPPLRERREDIVALARVFIARLAPDGSPVPELGADAVAALKSHGWPGNVRELRNVIERAMAYSPVPVVLRAEHLRILRA